MKVRKLLLPVIIIVTEAFVFADGGAVQLRKEAGDLVITLFASRERLTAGPMDFSVLLQDRRSLDPVLDADVSLHLRDETSGAQIEAQASRDLARNNILYAAPVTLERAGKWTVAFTVQRDRKRMDIAGAIDVAPTPAMVASYWGYITLPPLMLMAFVIQGWLIGPKR